MTVWRVFSPSMFSSFLVFFVGFVVFFPMFWSNMGESLMVEWSLLCVSSVIFSFSVIFDKMSLSFCLVVLLISFSVLLFAVSYMSGDVSLDYFIFMVVMFVFTMNVLIFVPHLLFLLLGWDGLGVTSYLLVIYYQNDSSLAAGMITAMTNRIGDALLILGSVWLFFQQSYSVLFSVWVGLMVMIAGMTKSAQVPFSAWLPAAMAAPTPVSALVHSSTLVTAGVYLLIRFYSLMCFFGFFNVFLFVTGFMTVFMASVSANYEYDLKKVIALSTLSQLGVMMFTIGLGLPNMAYFHMLTHALFKALLFICAGTIIHSMQNNQDLRLMGGLWSCMPVTASTLNLANLALCGLPFTAGFYSKDGIVESVFMSGGSFFSVLMFFLVICVTAAYSMRLSLFTLWSPYKHLSVSVKNDESVITYVSFFVLSFGAVMGGSVVSWIYNPSLEVIVMPFYFKVFALFAVFFYGFFSYVFYSSICWIFPSFNSSMWFMGVFTGGYFSSKVLGVGVLLNEMELTWMEYMMVKLYDEVVSFASAKLSESQSMSVSMLISVVIALMVCLILLFCR